MSESILVIAPHPDDEVLGCGGAILRHIDRGDAVHVLVVTRGAPEVFPPQQVEVVKQELRAAHQVLGVTGVRFLDFPAPKLDTIAGCDLADKINQAIRSVRPDTVYLPHKGDLHADHGLVFQATLVAARPINDCTVRRLLCYETLSETDWAPPFGGDSFMPTVFVDISAFLDRKLQAMACYQSQVKPPPASRSLQSLEALARVRGGTVGVAAAEAFVLVRELVS
jgi:LmbE family N-acetylglucosaminyl deacetylase